MASGVGIDLLEISRLERALERRPGLAERLFTPDERAMAAKQRRPAQHLAARFCAKEATAKALGLEAWSWQDIEVRGGGTTPPTVHLEGAPARRARELEAEVRISLTHSRETAGAIAVAE